MGNDHASRIDDLDDLRNSEPESGTRPMQDVRRLGVAQCRQPFELGRIFGVTAPAITVARDQAVLGALSLMTQRRIRHLPVVDEGRLIGFVSIGDLVKYRIDKIEADAEAMRSYIQAV